MLCSSWSHTKYLRTDTVIVTLIYIYALSFQSSQSSSSSDICSNSSSMASAELVQSCNLHSSIHLGPLERHSQAGSLHIHEHEMNSKNHLGSWCTRLRFTSRPPLSPTSQPLLSGAWRHGIDSRLCFHTAL